MRVRARPGCVRGGLGYLRGQVLQHGGSSRGCTGRGKQMRMGLERCRGGETTGQARAVCLGWSCLMARGGRCSE